MTSRNRTADILVEMITLGSLSEEASGRSLFVVYRLYLLDDDDVGLWMIFLEEILDDGNDEDTDAVK